MNSIKQFLLVLSVISITACGGGGGGSSSGGADAGHSAPISSGNDIKPIPVATDTTTEIPATSQNDTPSDTSTAPSENNTTPGSQNDSVGENTDSPTDTSILNDPVFSSNEPVAEDNSLVDASSADDPSAQVTLSGYAELSWFIPDSREDGTYLPVYEISGYEVRYSTDNGATYKTITINDAQTTDWRVENLAAGTYLFSIATIDTDGVHSQFSVPVTKQIL